MKADVRLKPSQKRDSLRKDFGALGTPIHIRKGDAQLVNLAKQRAFVHAQLSGRGLPVVVIPL